MTWYVLDILWIKLKELLEKIIEESDNGEINSEKKKKSYAKEGLLSIEQLQTDLEGSGRRKEQKDATRSVYLQRC